MVHKTYTTELPKTMLPFALAYAAKQASDRAFALELVQSDLSKTKQNQSLQKLGYNKRQANSLLIDMDGKAKSAVECRELHLSTLEGKIASAASQIATWQEKLSAIEFPKCDFPRNQFKTSQHRLRFKIHQKTRYLISQQRKLKALQDKPISVNFGTDNNFVFVGSQGESFGNGICQYDGTKIKIRVPVEMEQVFDSKYVTAALSFKYGQDAINAALKRRAVNSKSGKVIKATQGEALTWRIYQKNDRWYIAVTCNVSEVPRQSISSRYGCLGIDFNPGVIGWCVVDFNGNPIDKGQFKVNVHSRRSGQVEAELANVCAQLVKIAERYACPIVIERLDFSAKKKRMREESRRYARMLNAFAYGTFKEVLESQCNNRGVTLIKVNPAYSSLIGLTKFMRVYGMSSDTAAALVLARRAMRLSESIPDEYASLVVMTRKHVWSAWYRLNQKLKGSRRHSFYQPRLTVYSSNCSTLQDGALRSG